MYPVCSPALHRQGIDLEQNMLLDCAGLTGSWSSCCKSANRPFSRAADITLTSTFVIAIQAAIHGAGLAMGHDTLVRDLMRAGSLVAPFDHAPPLTEGYFLFPAPAHAQTPASRAFDAWLHEEMTLFHAQSTISADSSIA